MLLEHVKGIVKSKGLKNIDVADNGKLLMKKDMFISKPLGSVEDLEALVKSGGKPVAFTPPKDQLKLIRAVTSDEVEAEDFLSTSYWASNVLEDRGKERFLEPAMDDFKGMYPKKPLLLDHNWSAHDIVGKVYNAEHIDGWLRCDVIIPKSLTHICEMVRLSMFDKVSVGFAMLPEHYLCSVCEVSLFDKACPHIPGEYDEKSKSHVIALLARVCDVFELSIVGVPMNALAEQVKGSITPNIVAKSVQLVSGINPDDLPAGQKDNLLKVQDEITKMYHTVAPLMGMTWEQFRDTNADFIKSVNSIAQVLNDTGTMINDKDTTEGSLNMADTDNKAKPSELEGQKQDLPGDAQSDADKLAAEAAAKEAEEAAKAAEEAAKLEADAAAEAEKAATAAKVKADAEALEAQVKKLIAEGIQSTEIKFDASELTKAVESLKDVAKAMEPMLEVQKSLSEQLKTLDERIEKLEKLVDVTSNLSVESLKSLAKNEDEQPAVSTKNSWVAEMFGNANLGGQ